MPLQPLRRNEVSNTGDRRGRLAQAIIGGPRALWPVHGTRHGNGAPGAPWPTSPCCSPRSVLRRRSPPAHVRCPSSACGQQRCCRICPPCPKCHFGTSTDDHYDGSQVAETLHRRKHGRKASIRVRDQSPSKNGPLVPDGETGAPGRKAVAPATGSCWNNNGVRVVLDLGYGTVSPLLKLVGSVIRPRLVGRGQAGYSAARLIASSRRSHAAARSASQRAETSSGPGRTR